MDIYSDFLDSECQNSCFFEVHPYESFDVDYVEIILESRGERAELNQGLILNMTKYKTL